MKNILFIDNGKEYGGGTKSLLYLLEALNKEKEYKFKVFFEYDYSVEKSTISQYLESLNIEFLTFSFQRIKVSKLFKELYRLVSKEFLYKKELELNIDYAIKVLKSGNYDLIHLNNHFGSNLEYIIAANKLNIPVIQHLRKNSPLNKLQIHLLKDLKFHAISVSNATYDYYSKYIPHLEKEVIYNPFPFTIENELKSENRSNIKILMPANYLKNKGHSLVFNALDQIKREDIKLFLAGSGQFDKTTESLKVKLIQEKKLVELGFVDDMDTLYDDSDYIISFSENEGLPRVVLEGLLHGCGIISSNYSVSQEIYNICSNKDKYFIINRKVINLIELLSTLNSISKKEVDHNILNQFSLDKYTNSIFSFYSRIL